MLTHWTRKILVEEGHSIGQLVHILQLIVRHVDVYQPVRQHLLHHVTTAMHKLGFSMTANLEQKRLAVDLAEVSTGAIFVTKEMIVPLWITLILVL